MAASPLGAIKSRVRTLTERVRLSEGRSSSLEPAKSAVRWKVRQRNQGSQSELGGSGQPTRKQSGERPVHSSSASPARPDRPGRSEGRTTEGNRTSCSSSRPSDWRVRDAPDRMETPGVADHEDHRVATGWRGNLPGLSGPVLVIPALSALKAHEPDSVLSLVLHGSLWALSYK